MIKTIKITNDKTKVARKPNFIFILADDMGWGDLSCYGHPELRTPNLDRLAGQGKLFTQFYVCSGVCSPSRVSFTTGRYPARYGVHGHFSSPEENRQRNMPNWLDTGAPTIAKQLKKAGYKTAHFGKWHMSQVPPSDSPEPKEYGFDISKGYLCSGEQIPVESAENPYFRAQSTEAIIDETIKFIEENKSEPFYINAWTLIPHTILNPTPEQMSEYENYKPNILGKPHAGAKVVYYATINDLDREVGRLLDKLRQLGLEEDTIVIFSSDNGPEDIHFTGASHSGIGSPGPFRGKKRSLYEGGIRVPLIISWKDKIQQGSIDNDSVLASADFLPTICELAGAEVPDGNNAPDGESAADIILSNTRPRKTPLMWEYHYEMEFGHIIHKNPIMAIRQDNWKLLINPDESRIELYDIPNDPTELNNLADKNTAIVKMLKEKLLDWHNEMPKADISQRAGNNDYPWPGKQIAR